MGESPSGPSPSHSQAPDDSDHFVGGLTRPELLKRVAQHYAQGLARSLEAQEYLRDRSLGDVEAAEEVLVSSTVGERNSANFSSFESFEHDDAAGAFFRRAAQQSAI